MMRRVVTPLRLVVVVAGILLLPRPARMTLAQGGGQFSTCITSFFIEPDTQACANCCANWSASVNSIDTVDDSSPGDQSAMDDQVNCGGVQQGQNCGSNCDTADWYVPYTDGTCCTPNNDYCSGDDNCCSGACDVSTVSCVACVPDGDSPGSPYDCCSEYNSYTGVCGSSTSCTSDTDCADLGDGGEVCDLSSGQCVFCVQPYDLYEQSSDCCCSAQGDYCGPC